jgi:hypothetical protein
MSISPLRVDFASVSATQAEHHITRATMSLMIFPVPPVNQGFTIGANKLNAAWFRQPFEIKPLAGP